MNKENIKFETLHKKINVKNIIIGVLVVTLIVLVIVNRVSHAAYTSTLDVPFVRGKINYKHPDFKVMGMYVQAGSGSTTYNEINTMPSASEYTINSSKSYCTKGVQGEKDPGVILKTENGNHVVANLIKNDRCYLYFDLNISLTQIFAKYTKDNSRNGEITADFAGNTPTTVYSKEDEDGTSYVFAGKNPNNWVRIGSMYFRIIRFNGDGSLRLIYSGATKPEVSGAGTRIGNSEFNIRYYDNAYVGFMYGSEATWSGGSTGRGKHSTSYNSAHENSKSSTIKTVLDEWYTNLSIYDSVIDKNAGFCGERKVSTVSRDGFGFLGYGINNTVYSPKDRFYNTNDNPLTSYTPSLKCSRNEDLYTISSSNKGNKALTYPIGLITADEYLLAGGGLQYSYNTNCWLYTEENYWTMTPFYYEDMAFVNYVSFKGSLNYANYCVNVDAGVRPVINLKSSVTFEVGGTGTSIAPYVVSVN